MTVEDLSSETSYEYRALAASDDATDGDEILSFTTEAGEIGEPAIERLSVADTSPPNPHVDLEVNWSVSHDASALSEYGSSFETVTTSGWTALRALWTAPTPPDWRRSE